MEDIVLALKFIAIGIVSISFMGSAISQGMIGMKAVEAIGRNPEAENKIKGTMIIACAIAESGSIYGLVVSLILIFVI